MTVMDVTLTVGQIVAAGVVLAVFVVLVVALAIMTGRCGYAELRVLELEAAYPSWAARGRALQAQEERIRASEWALRSKAQETALFARLAVEMGLPLPDSEDGDTIATHEG